ncbi:hypothetical protein NKH56_28080 [Mesorhizobium sp. M1076]|uniref:hypothetical protein n=1 Tax=Mesorhizobium sp. M1076 TaxID=2957054 RepID=UPI00333CC29B
MARRRRSQGNTGLILASAGLAVLIVALLGGFAYLKIKASDHVPLDKTTMCPETGPIAVTVVLMDTTDPITDITKSKLKTEFDKVVSSLPIGGLMEIYNLTDVQSQLTPLFAACNPGDGSEVDEMTDNPRLRKKRWKEAFDDPLQKIRTDDIGNGSSGTQSPIMAGIQRVKVDLFDRKDVADIPKTLVIASDMIEHTKFYSQYSSGIDYAVFDKSAAKREFRTNLDDVDVTILYFERSGVKFNPLEHVRFWAKWFSERGVRNVATVRLEGMN